MKASIRLAYIAWILAAGLLLIYEGFALVTGGEGTLSRAIWTIDSGVYGTFIPAVSGFLCGHLFTSSWKVFFAFSILFICGSLFWHAVIK